MNFFDVFFNQRARVRKFGAGLYEGLENFLFYLFFFFFLFGIVLKYFACFFSHESCDYANDQKCACLKKKIRFMFEKSFDYCSLA